MLNFPTFNALNNSSIQFLLKALLVNTNSKIGVLLNIVSMRRLNPGLQGPGKNMVSFYPCSQFPILPGWKHPGDPVSGMTCLLDLWGLLCWREGELYF